mmetsp:Transcript_56336/g.138263  ORF Transcript_56336/g.138263 Transcript_56336/m.138263 type:complete len:257 (+) Transcript_56336:1124-1894(+)
MAKSVTADVIAMPATPAMARSMRSTLMTAAPRARNGTANPAAFFAPSWTSGGISMELMEGHEDPFASGLSEGLARAASIASGVSTTESLRVVNFFLAAAKALVICFEVLTTADCALVDATTTADFAVPATADRAVLSWLTKSSVLPATLLAEREREDLALRAVPLMRALADAKKDLVLARKTEICARIMPQTWLRIVIALDSCGEMTTVLEGGSFVGVLSPKLNALTIPSTRCIICSWPSSVEWCSLSMERPRARL